MSREYRTARADGTGTMMREDDLRRLSATAAMRQMDSSETTGRADADDVEIDEEAAQRRSLARLDALWRNPDGNAPEQDERTDGEIDPCDEDAAALRSLARLDQGWRSEPEIVTKHDRSYIRQRRVR